MFRRLTTTLNIIKQARCFSSTPSYNHRVVVIGAAGGSGQAISMLMKMNSRVTELTLYDQQCTAGMAADLNGILTISEVRSFKGKETLKDALNCANIVIVAAGVPRTSVEQTREDLFLPNADMVAEVIEAIAKICPKAMILIITNPVNSLVPYCAEILKKHKAYDPKRLFGMSYMDTIRAHTFTGDAILRDPAKIRIPVIGGHSNNTILPILSNSNPMIKEDEEIVKRIYDRIRAGADLIVQAKKGTASSQLSVAYAADIICGNLLKAMDKVPGITITAYVESNVTKLPFFSSQIELNVDGVASYLKLPQLDNYEKGFWKIALQHLENEIHIGIDHARKQLKDNEKSDNKPSKK